MRRGTKATLADLISIRSWLADELIDYLAGPDPERPSGLVGELDALPLFLKRENRRLTIGNTFIEPTVLTEQQPESRRWRPAREEEKDADAEPRNTAVLEDMARHLCEHQRSEDENEAVRWRQFVRTLREPVVLLGASGGGKTCASRAAVLECAEQAATELRSGAKPPEDVVVPSWITASD